MAARSHEGSGAPGSDTHDTHDGGTPFEDVRGSSQAGEEHVSGAGRAAHDASSGTTSDDREHEEPVGDPTNEEPGDDEEGQRTDGEEEQPSEGEASDESEEERSQREEARDRQARAEADARNAQRQQQAQRDEKKAARDQETAARAEEMKTRANELYDRIMSLNEDSYYEILGIDRGEVARAGGATSPEGKKIITRAYRDAAKLIRADLGFVPNDAAFKRLNQANGVLKGGMQPPRRPAGPDPDARNRGSDQEQRDAQNAANAGAGGGRRSTRTGGNAGGNAGGAGNTPPGGNAGNAGNAGAGGAGNTPPGGNAGNAGNAGAGGAGNTPPPPPSGANPGAARNNFDPRGWNWKKGGAKAGAYVGGATMANWLAEFIGVGDASNFKVAGSAFLTGRAFNATKGMWSQMNTLQRSLGAAATGFFASNMFTGGWHEKGNWIAGAAGAAAGAVGGTNFGKRAGTVIGSIPGQVKVEWETASDHVKRGFVAGLGFFTVAEISNILDWPKGGYNHLTAAFSATVLGGLVYGGSKAKEKYDRMSQDEKRKVKKWAIIGGVATAATFGVLSYKYGLVGGGKGGDHQDKVPASNSGGGNGGTTSTTLNTGGGGRTTTTAMPGPGGGGNTGGGGGGNIAAEAAFRRIAKANEEAAKLRARQLGIKLNDEQARSLVKNSADRLFGGDRASFARMQSSTPAQKQAMIDYSIRQAAGLV